MEDFKPINKLDNLRKIREKRNITQVKLATDLGVTQELISRYELGSSFPQVHMLINLSQYFNCSVDYLLGLTDIETPIKYLSNNYNTDIISKYNSLSNKDKSHIDSYISFLSNNTNN